MVFYSAVFSLLFYSQYFFGADQIQLVEANHPEIRYTGRIDFSNPRAPRFWQSGVYIKFTFKGSFCSVLIADQLGSPDNHNYITVVIDDGEPERIKLSDKNNTISIGQNLNDGEHTVVVSKATEAGVGFLEFKGILTKEILPSKPKTEKKLEFIGDSITCGMGADISDTPCGKGKWHDQHNAYLSYGAIVARDLNAQYHLSSVSGIGMMKSCCNMTITMPQVFDNTNMRDDQETWDFKYQPDIVTICLGQNDGKQDSVAFATTYINFIKDIRSKYPQASVVCLTSPMASKSLNQTLQNYITGIVTSVNSTGDKKVSKFFFSRSYNSGCGGHPDVSEHKMIAAELTAYLKKNFEWFLKN
jgi:hypothetical protein